MDFSFGSITDHVTCCEIIFKHKPVYLTIKKDWCKCIALYDEVIVSIILQNGECQLISCFDHNEAELVYKYLQNVILL